MLLLALELGNWSAPVAVQSTDGVNWFRTALFNPRMACAEAVPVFATTAQPDWPSTLEFTYGAEPLVRCR